jgi:hypothetical protein
MGNLPPAGGGLLDLKLPWATVTGHSPEPGHLSRLGPITPAQAAHLADLAARDPTVRWQVIVTNPHGQAVAAARLRRLAGTGARAPGQAGLVRQVTIIISPDDLTNPQPQVGLPPILSRVLAAAQSAARESAARDADTRDADPRDTNSGGCAHTDATTSYRPTTRLWDYVTARDLTCRFCTCRQPATRCDLDHTTPFDQGGVTCSCNLGAGCRFHHQIKQHPGWHLAQPTPGTFTWTTPTGRTYATQPDTHTA